MEFLLLELRAELRQQTEKLNELAEALNELKAENSFLKMEVLGVGNNNLPNGEGVSLIESKTIREVVDRIQFDLTEVKALVKGCPVNKPTDFRSSEGDREPLIEYDMPEQKQKLEDFSPVPIKSKTAFEEMELMKAKCDELKQSLEPLSAGGTLAGTTIEDISSSVEFSDTVNASIVMKFSNYLMSTIKCTSESYFPDGENKLLAERMLGPTKIIGLYTEAFGYQAGRRSEKQCAISLQVEIEPNMFLTLYCDTYASGVFYLRFGLIPTVLGPVDSWKLVENCATLPESSVKMSRDSESVADLVASNEKYLVRARMTPGPKSFVYIDIFQTPQQNPNQLNLTNHFIVDGKSLNGGAILKFLQSEPTGSSPNSVSCVVEIVNGLDVPLKNVCRFTQNCSHHSLMPNEVSPLHREIFFASDESAVEEIFSYEIDMTDVRLEIAMRMGTSGNEFGAAFVPNSSKTTEEDLKVSLKPPTWKTLMSRKYANASEGEQVIWTRNIRARVSMTNEKRSTMKIFVYTI